MAIQSGPQIIGVFSDLEISLDEVEANARLTAAAPELLDACKMLLKVLIEDCDAEAFASEISHAEGVIAAAEGGIESDEDSSVTPDAV